MAFQWEKPLGIFAARAKIRSHHRSANVSFDDAGIHGVG